MNRIVRLGWIGTICFLASTGGVLGQSRSPAVPSDGNGDSSPTAHKGKSGNSDAAGSPDAPPDTPQPRDAENKVLSLPRAFLHDQIGMWTSPARARLPDATWLVPLGGLTAALLASDTDFSRHLSNDPNTLLRYRHISDYGLYSMAGAAGGSYFLGLLTHNEHERETGFLSGEATADVLVAVEALKYATRRQRPYQDNGNGEFWKGGTSFPAEHAAAAWSIAGIVAHEYPSPFMKLLSYGMATAVSVSRIEAKEHFPSDVLVGAALGYLSSEYVYRKHHNPDLPGESWELPAIRPDRPSHWQSKFMGSPYVPLDSWIYPALDRLIALGAIHTGFLDMRPWTRIECARLVMEAQDQMDEEDAGQRESTQLFHELETEFAPEEELLGGGNNADIRLESAYSRSTEIAGKPLTDGYHFGQTVINDYGRPYEQGFNNVSGMTGYAEDGPFAGYARVEYQHAPEAPALPLAARQAMANEDLGPDSYLGINPAALVPPGTPTAAIDQPHLLDGYVAMNVHDWQLSYGKQSLWWGPGRGGPMMFSNDADPMRMFRLNRVTPFRLPGFLGVLGPMRVELFLGQFSGYQFLLTPTGLAGQWGVPLNPQPIIHGERFSFKPTGNLEIGFSRTTDYGGPGYPLTWHTFLKSVFSTSNTIPGQANKPGSRRSGLDFSYRIPGLRNGLTFYADGLAEHDEITPLLGPDVAAWSAGIYVPSLPGIPKLDFRAEGVYTSPPYNGGDISQGAFYWDATWITGFQNSNHLMGSWVGREGQGAQGWSSYWLTPRDKLEFSFRHQKVSYQFVPDGGTVTDGGVRADFWVRSIFSVSASVQCEAWTFPVIEPNRRTNVTTMLQLSIWPKPRSSGRGNTE